MSGREQEYEPYKAERRPRPDLLREQWPHLEPLVEAFGYENVRVEGYEADDVIASLAEQAKQAGIPVMIVTGDRDAYQLAENGSVRIMTTSRGITDTRVYDREGVVERYGIPPELVTDFIGLKGDTSDNIPGVPGIGDKTAAQLLQQYGSLESVLEHIDDISGEKRRQNLRENADLARISKSLATLHRGIDAGVDVAEIAGREPDRSRLREVFTRFELRDPLRRLEEALGEQEAAPRAVGERRIEADGARDDAGRHRGARRRGGAGGRAATASTLRWAAHDGGEQVLAGSAATLAELLEAWAAGRWSRTTGRPSAATPATARRPAARCASRTTRRVAAYLLDPARRQLPAGRAARPGRHRAGGRGAATSAARAAVGVHALSADQQEEIDRLELRGLLEDIELPLVDVLYRLELPGGEARHLPARRDRRRACRRRSRSSSTRSTSWPARSSRSALRSSSRRILFEKLELSRKRRGKTGFSTDARVLRAIREEHPIIEKVERWRELTKLRSTYLDELPALIDERHRAAAHDVQPDRDHDGTAVEHGPEPAEHPDPHRARAPDPQLLHRRGGARLISADYSQVELRILAHVAGEEVLKSIFERGEDVHTATAAEVLKLEAGEIGPGERSRAKAVNFGIVYGLSAHGLSEQLAIPTRRRPSTSSAT